MQTNNDIYMKLFDDIRVLGKVYVGKTERFYVTASKSVLFIGLLYLYIRNKQTIMLNVPNSL
jgi:hypothetical protein